MKLCFTTAILGLTALSSMTGQSASSNDWLVVPGVRVGPVTATTVRADLKRLFPEAPIEEQELELDEGMVFPATMVSRATQGESLAIVWTSKNADARPKQIFLCRGRRRGACKWHAGEIAVGATLTDLEKINGGPFTVQGFGWTYGGNIISWDGGKIDKLDCNKTLSVAIDGQRDREGDLTMPLTADEVGTFSGNRPIPSTTPALRKLNPAITEMLFIFPAAGAKPCAR